MGLVQVDHQIWKAECLVMFISLNNWNAQLTVALYTIEQGGTKYFGSRHFVVDSDGGSPSDKIPSVANTKSRGFVDFLYIFTHFIGSKSLQLSVKYSIHITNHK
jgi:hypothetical protein